MALVHLEGTSKDVPSFSPAKRNMWQATSLVPNQQIPREARVITRGIDYDRTIFQYVGTASTPRSTRAQRIAVDRLYAILRGRVTDLTGAIGSIARSMVDNEALIEGVRADAAIGENERTQKFEAKFWERIRARPEAWEVVATRLREAQLAVVAESDTYVRRPDVTVWFSPDIAQRKPFHLIRLGGLAVQDVERETIGHENLLHSFNVLPICGDKHGREGVMPYDNSQYIFFDAVSGLDPQHDKI